MNEEFRGGVQVKNLTWTPFASARPLLNNLTFTIAPGEKVLLVGPSGSGKSTLLRAIAGVLLDTESGDLTGSINCGSVGLMLQDPNDTIVAPTLLREVAFGPENACYPSSDLEALVSRNLALVKIDKPLQSSSTDLSGGEMQRVALAGVLALQAGLLLLDEPTSMLDIESAKSVRSAVLSALSKEGQTLILAEHRFDDWLRDMDRILVLSSKGELLFDGPPIEVLEAHRTKLLELGIWIPGEPAPIPESAITPPRNSAEGSAKGSITVLTGNSGAGKTTLLKQMLRSDPAAKTILDGVGFVPQQPELTVVGDSVFESANFTARLAAKGLGIDAAESDAHTHQLLKDLGLNELEEQNPYEISGGEQRRLAVATAFSHYPRSAYLDEPTVGQDREAWSAIVGSIIAARDAGTQIVIASHDEDLISLADEVVKIVPEISSPVTPKPALVSGFAIIASPLILLVGSMGITTVRAGLTSILAWAAFWIAFSLFGLKLKIGLKFKAPKIMIAPIIGVLSIGLSNWYLSAGFALESGMTAALRVASFVFPGVLLASKLRPYRLGDQLAQTLRLPTRPVIAAMVAMERISFFTGMWSEIRFIQGIRGVTIHKGLVSRVRSSVLITFAMLIQAIRGAGTTAVAMDARGFSAEQMTERRTWAEPAKFGRLDLPVIIASVLVSSLPFLVH